MVVALVIVFVEGIEQGTVSQNSRPDHTGRPDDKLTKESTETEAKNLGPKGKQDLESHGGGLAVEDMLCERNIVWINPTTGTIDHDCNANVFLDWKGSWVEGPDITKSIEAFGG